MVIAKVRGARLAYAKLESILGLEELPESADTGRTLIIVRPAVGAVFALDVEVVVDNEELVVKPGAPLVMATGLYAGTSLPDNGRPMLLLDASGLCAAIGFDQDLFEIELVREGAAHADRNTESRIRIVVYGHGRCEQGHQTVGSRPYGRPGGQFDSRIGRTVNAPCSMGSCMTFTDLGLTRLHADQGASYL